MLPSLFYHNLYIEIKAVLASFTDVPSISIFNIVNSMILPGTIIYTIPASLIPPGKGVAIDTRYGRWGRGHYTCYTYRYVSQYHTYRDMDLLLLLGMATIQNYLVYL